MSAGETKQGLERGHRGTTAVEAEHKLVEVRRQMLALNAVVSASEPGLEIAEGLMDTREDDQGALRVTAPRLWAVPVAHADQRRVALPAIGEDDRPGLDVPLHEATQGGGRRVAHDLQPDPPRAAAADLDGAHDQRALAELATTSKSFLVTDKGLIDFNFVPQRLSLGPAHGPAQLMEHRPGRFVAPDPQLTLQLKRREARRMSRHQVGGPEPLRQWDPGSMQDGSCRHRGVPPARLAPPQQTPRQFERFSLLAPRTTKSVRPSRLSQVCAARLLVDEAPLELAQGPGEVWPRHNDPRYPLGSVE